MQGNESRRVEFLGGGAVNRGPGPVAAPLGTHFTQLPEATEGDIFYHEWNTYRREVGRLLAENHEGQYVLIKGKNILGIFPTWKAAREAGLQRYLLEPFLVHPIRAIEPNLRIRGINHPCPI